MVKSVLIVGLTGMPGAGKSTLARSLSEAGLPVIIMGDVVRDAAINAKLELNDINLGYLMVKLRKQKGQGAIAYFVQDKIRTILGSSAHTRAIIIDGIRNVEEMRVLAALGPIKLLAVHGSTQVRFDHIKARARADAPVTIDDFCNRDNRELSVGLNNAIALADETLSNNGISIKQFCRQGLRIIEKWILENKDLDRQVELDLNLRLDHDLDPVLNVTVTGETAIKPSEDVQKVIRCLINTINGGDQSVKRNYVVVKTKGLLALHHIRVGIKLRHSARVLQRLVEYNRDGNSTWFLLNKQAAYCGIIAIVESWHESSLGPIKVTIQSSDLDRLLTWLIPPVIKVGENKFHGSELKTGDTFARSKKY